MIKGWDLVSPRADALEQLVPGDACERGFLPSRYDPRVASAVLSSGGAPELGRSAVSCCRGLCSLQYCQTKLGVQNFMLLHLRMLHCGRMYALVKETPEHA
jgi:hypothetical protein